MLRSTIVLIAALFCSVAAEAATLREFCYEEPLTGEIRCGLIFEGVMPPMPDPVEPPAR